MILKENQLEHLQNVNLSRKEIEYVCQSDRFIGSNNDFSRQFAHIYTVRLNQMRQSLADIAKSKWEGVTVRSLAEMAAQSGGRSVVVGTISKLQPLKPSVLKEISEEHQLVPQPPPIHYTSPEDSLVLEDETQRIRLKGNIDVRQLVTGLVVAVLGHEGDDGSIFVVEDLCFATPAPSDIPLPSLDDDCYIALFSGFYLATTADLLSMQMAADWLTGVGGTEADQSKAASVVRVILTGGLIGQDTEAEDLSHVVEGSKLLDKFVFQLAQSVVVDVVPGETDPTNHCLPQQPLMPCILREASRMRSCCISSNPYDCIIGGRRLLASGGQNIDNLLKVTDDMDSFQLLKSTLKWGHIAPTAPDTLPCYPYYEKDPFIIAQQPDIYVAGNQPTYETELIKNPSNPDRPCRVISVPKFSSTRTMVLVNLRTLDCTPIDFTHPAADK